MKPVKPGYAPDASLSREEMKTLQQELAQQADFSDSFDLQRSLDDVTVAGVDQAFLDAENPDSPGGENQRFSRAVSGVVSMRDGEVVERVHGGSKLEMPYISGLLAFREGSCIIDALSSLSEEPDLLVFDGSGRIHFRQAGIATHIGVMYDTPAIGVAKNLLCGEPAEDIEDLEEGEKVAVNADAAVNVENGETIGYAYQSRTYDSGSRRINPLYVSPGHRVDEETAVDIIAKLCEGYKLPEPTRRADSYVEELKQKM